MNEDLMKVIKSEEEIEQEVESLCRWAAARAGVICRSTYTWSNCSSC